MNNNKYFNMLTKYTKIDRYTIEHVMSYLICNVNNNNRLLHPFVYLPYGSNTRESLRIRYNKREINFDFSSFNNV